MKKIKPKKIMIVDDDPDIVRDIRDALQNWSHSIEEIIIAGDGNAAVELYQLHKPELVILDLFLPRRSGLHVLEKWKARKLTESKPYVIAITGVPGKRYEEAADYCHANAFFRKPLDIHELCIAIDRGLVEVRRYYD